MGTERPVLRGKVQGTHAEHPLAKLAAPQVTRGLKPTPYQNPGTTIGQPTIVIIPEYKAADSGPKVGACLQYCRPHTVLPLLHDASLPRLLRAQAAGAQAVRFGAGLLAPLCWRMPASAWRRRQGLQTLQQAALSYTFSLHTT